MLSTSSSQLVSRARHVNRATPIEWLDLLRNLVTLAPMRSYRRDENERGVIRSSCLWREPPSSDNTLASHHSRLVPSVAVDDRAHFFPFQTPNGSRESFFAVA